MNELFLFQTLKSIKIILILSLPPMIGATIVGVVFGLFQAVTQIQEQTLSFTVKMMAVMGIIIATLYWSGSQLLFFAQDIFDRIPVLVQ